MAMADRGAEKDPKSLRMGAAARRLWTLVACTVVLAASSLTTASQGNAPHLAAGRPLIDDLPELAAFEVDSRQQATRRQLDEIKTRRLMLRQRTLVRGKAFVRLMRFGLLPLSDGFQGLIAHASHLERLRRGLARDLAEDAALAAETSELTRGLGAALKQREELAAQLVDYRRSREAILAARERELAFKRAFEQGYRPRSSAAVYGSVGTDSSSVTTFPELRGRLPFPVEGRSELTAVGADGQSGPGLLLVVPGETPVKSVFRGKIVLIGEFAQRGPAVVVDHGHGYSTLVANLSRISVEVGDEVAAAAEIGVYAPGPLPLYFEVRRDGDPLPPADWFGI